MRVSVFDNYPGRRTQVFANVDAVQVMSDNQQSTIRGPHDGFGGDVDPRRVLVVNLATVRVVLVERAEPSAPKGGKDAD